MKMTKMKERLFKLKLPHTYVILSIILLSVVFLTYVIPSGEYNRVLDVSTGREVVDPSSFHFVEGHRPSFFDIFISIQKGYVSAASIIFLILFAYGYVHMLVENGTFNAGISNLIRLLGNKVEYLIPIMMFLFGVLGSTMGIFEEVYGLVPVFISIFMAMGYDRMVGGAIVIVGVATGFAAATTNPFSVGIAQSIADVAMFSGLGFRIIVFLVFQSASIWYVMRYAERVKENPLSSVIMDEEFKEYEINELEETPPITLRQKICLVLFFFTISLLLYGTMKLDWYIDEISAMFLMMMVISGIVGGYSATKISLVFIAATKSMVSSILVVGFTRAIVLIMQDAMISDTLVYYLTSFLFTGSKYLSAIGMLIIQNIINFFITGSTSQATITIPIMSSVADILDISRQTSVLIYQFGDGFSDLFWPTACSLTCGLMGVKLEEWYKFIWPLFFIMIILQIIFVVISIGVFS